MPKTKSSSLLDIAKSLFGRSNPIYIYTKALYTMTLLIYVTITATVLASSIIGLLKHVLPHAIKSFFSHLLLGFLLVAFMLHHVNKGS